jgi:hypothetical protein
MSAPAVFLNTSAPAVHCLKKHPDMSELRLRFLALQKEVFELKALSRKIQTEKEKQKEYTAEAFVSTRMRN